MHFRAPVGIAFVTALASALPQHARAAPRRAASAESQDERPWGQGILLPAFGFGFGYSQALSTLGFSLGLRYFVVRGLSLGVTFSDQILLLSKGVKRDFPGIEDDIPTNIFEITPTAQYVFYRSRWFSPYVAAGVGPTFFNNQNGVVGHWTAGPGAYIGLTRFLFLDLGIGFSGLFPRDKCNDAFVYRRTGTRVIDGFCSFSLGPRIGLVFAFGVGRKPARTSTPPAAPRNPMSDPHRTSPPPEPTGQTEGLQPDASSPPEGSPADSEPPADSGPPAAPGSPESGSADPSTPPDASAPTETSPGSAGQSSPPPSAERSPPPPAAVTADNPQSQGTDP